MQVGNIFVGPTLRVALFFTTFLCFQIIFMGETCKLFLCQGPAMNSLLMQRFYPNKPNRPRFLRSLPQGADSPLPFFREGR